MKTKGWIRSGSGQGQSNFQGNGSINQRRLAMKDYDKIIKEKGLPNVGQTVRSKKYSTLWRVMEKKEIWRNIDPDPKTNEPRMVPAIYLLYWKVEEGVSPGVGKMMGFEYTLYDNTFKLNWNILNE
jgi:hypothetical protein